ncbi:sigma-54-dependent Fis family transcriptional regulator [Pseudoalteromonas luteoviolacea]|uniref:sigma-54-dependent transcriptional regulator n=1 Tax=Pseudoalteromonas luteoviolacea TaxID=43657 RepID=UPI001B3732AE|nr:sigma-54 dependent transcriptional regulator [Pseudoalteromonas luteoviolacea]MBQ4811630.1 sigma-54-dependent Fis family transcriptional regulator [Pseudoalteromonas luteoviolacea]
MNTILVVDDNPDILDALDLLLSIHNYKVLSASSVKEALLSVSRQKIDLVIQDMNFSEGTTSGEEGKQLFYEIKSLNPALPIIVITAWSQLETAITLIKSGAADYLPKPWDDQKLLEIIAEHIATKSQPDENNALIYQSKEMAELIFTATKVAAAQINVLVTGPNGSGKEKLADFIHQKSKRANEPFVKVNMGAIPQDLMEAELFGAEKGAFTGANQARAGRFEAADGGTLFLDEIGNLSLSGQMKLLRVLQTGEFERLGSNVTQTVDVRVISATNANLLIDIKNGAFREDLYYRLNGMELSILPLHKRKGDILPLAQHFLGGDAVITKDAEQFLLQHSWPGNVRELENTCKRALIFAEDGRVTASAFSGLSQSASLSEKEHISAVLEKHDWTIAHAAQELGLSRQTLYRRIEKFKLFKDEQ